MTSPILTGLSPAARSAASASSAPRREATTAVPIPQLKVRSNSSLRDAAGSRQPAKYRRQWNFREIELGPKPLWQDARQIIGKTAASDMGEGDVLSVAFRSRQHEALRKSGLAAKKRLTRGREPDRRARARPNPVRRSHHDSGGSTKIRWNAARTKGGHREYRRPRPPALATARHARRRRRRNPRDRNRLLVKAGHFRRLAAEQGAAAFLQPSAMPLTTAAAASGVNLPVA